MIFLLPLVLYWVIKAYGESKSTRQKVQDVRHAEKEERVHEVIPQKEKSKSKEEQETENKDYE